jgi:tetratricopeptide (TPR) repeat protein
MRRSPILIVLIALAMSLLFSAAVSAQTGQLRGHVVIKQEDGTSVPLAGAVIDVFRTDIGGKYETKTDKRGQFVFAGVPFTGDYIISASAPNAAPYAKGNVKAGRDIDYELSLVVGDGRRYTEAEAKDAVKGGGTDAGKPPTESAADKARRDAAAKQYEAEKVKVANVNEVLNRTFKAGNDAMTAKNYDEAVRQYDEGLAADPEQVVFYARKANALRSRGVDHYNLSVKSTDAAVKTSELEIAKKDFQLAADTINKGNDIAKKEAVGTDPAASAARKLEILSGRAETMRLLVKVDPSQGEAALTAYQEYIAAESDAVKKAKAEKDIAQILFDSASSSTDVVAGYDRAVAAYKKILETDPNDTDAMLRIGQSLFNVGAITKDKGDTPGSKAKYQEAVNYLQLFVNKSAEGQLKEEAKQLIEVSKAEANVKPEAITPPGRRRRP